MFAQTTYSFNLPAQALADSLRELGSQARVNVIFDPAAVKGHSAPALKGSYLLTQALSKVLDGSGFTAEFTGATTIVIKPLPGVVPTPSSPPEHNGGRHATAPPAPATLDKITVLGSLIPRSKIETASSLIVITAQDIKNRGFSSVADALQNLTISTGSANGTSASVGDAWSVKTVSLFGLDPTYTKFMIDGRPMPLVSQTLATQFSNTHQLYTNLSSIPIDLVERIEILPGGHSSLYGSDAIAGVINIVLKKNVRFGTVNARYGWYSDGGGRERMLSATDSFAIGKLSLMVGAQVNDQQPIWNFQRRITSQNFAGGINPQELAPVASAHGFSGLTYFPTQASDCSKLAHLWRGSVLYEETSYGADCGSASANAYSTMMNKNQAASVNVHAEYAISGKTQLYGDFLDSYEKQSVGFAGNYGDLIYDPSLQDDVLITRNFAPEEIATSLDRLLTENKYSNTFTGTVGVKVDFGSDWNLDVGFTRGYERSDDRQIAMLADGVAGSYGNYLLGPQLGVDAGGNPIHSPNYGLLGEPVTPAQYAGYLGAGSITSSDRNDLLRAQLTQASLFALPGGDAGLALVVEEGYETWKYLPSPALTSGKLQGVSFTPSNGHRSRYATAVELDLPLFKMLTADLSARYDSYDAEGAHFSHPTYGLGLEFRPIDQLLLRGRYATSFKAPSLIDQFEGGRAQRSYATDYVNCARLGFTGANAGGCPSEYSFETINLVQASNPDLQPMTAKSFSYGAVWSPTASLSMNVDYQHISIRNEVLLQSAHLILQNELYCADGTLDPSSPTCRATAAQITRASAPPGSPLLGRVLGIVAEKVNVANELNNSITAGFQYHFALQHIGQFELSSSWTRVLTHRQQQFPGDPPIDYLHNPGFSAEFQTKGNVALSWHRGKWGATVFGTYFGPTPNYAAQLNNGYDVPFAGRVPAWRIYNASVDYSPTRAWRVSMHINNIKNSMPPIDVTSPGYLNTPFNSANYNAFGRELLLEARYQFGHDGGH